jgi:ABC-type molybdate transport system substrate-binding protein
VDGRHRSLMTLGRTRTRAAVAVAGVLVVALAAWAGYAYGTSRGDGADCTTPVSVNVAAAPEIAGVLAHIAAGLTPEQRADGDTCYVYQVFGQEPAQVAAALTGTAKDLAADVWVPDSTYWLREAGAVNLDLPQQGQSIATSPMVLAMPEQVAKRFGWPAKPLAWSSVLAAAETANPLQVGIADPGNSPVGLFGLMAVRGIVQGSNRPDTARVAAFRQLSRNVAAPTDDLLDALRKGNGATIALAAAPVSEQAVVQYSRIRQPVPMVAAYPDAAVPGLDYPYVVLPGASDQVRTAAQRFLAVALRADPTELAARGFRAPDGTAGPSFPTAGGIDTRRVPLATLPAQADVDGLLAEWAGVNQSGRILAVIDVSGSMNQLVPGTDKTRMELTKQTAQAGMGLFKPTTEAGLWIFSTDLPGGKDYQELLPIGPLYAQGAKAIAAIGRIQAKPNGSTGLYDTVLAGYQTLRAGWNPARINALVVLTDGQNEDPNGITRPVLLTKLRALADPRKPLRIIFIGLGTDVNATELSQIAAVTGGRAFVTPDPRKIADIFLAALASMTCVPPDCTRR